MKTINVGILGATGYIGKPYRKELRACQDVRIVGLCARRQDLLEAAGREDEAECLTSDWREIVTHPEIDLVIVATPDALHYEAVLACAREGKHVLCEKPVGVDVREARELWEAYRQCPHLAHFVPFWVRYTKAMERVKDLVQEGALGEIRGVVYRWHNPRPDSMPFTWRDDPKLSSAGSIADVGSHAYDTVRWIFGEDAQRVLAHAETLSPRVDAGEVNLKDALDLGQAQRLADAPVKPGKTVDYASIAWEFAGGAVGVLVLSHAPYFRKGLAPELELHGTEASVSVDRVSGHVTRVDSAQAPEVIDTLPDLPTTNRFEAYVIPAVRRAMDGLERSSNHPDLEDGYRVQLFTDAAATSARRGGWVEVRDDALGA